MACFQDEAVGGVGGFVYDMTGVNMQFRYAVCDRIGRTDFERLPPFDEFSKPGRGSMRIPAGDQHELPPRARWRPSADSTRTSSTSGTTSTSPCR